MQMTSSTIDNINQIVDEKANLVKFFRGGSSHEELKNLDIDWSSGKVNKTCNAARIIENEGYFGENKTLSQVGLLLLSRLCLDLEASFMPGSVIADKYEIRKVITTGKNSATFLAIHKVLLSEVVVKVVRPGASTDIVSALRLLSDNSLNSHVVRPVDYVSVNIKDVFGRDLNVDCVVFPYIKGETLREFLKKEHQPINSYTVISFIKQVGEALSSLELLGAYHGDLHEDNIIVNYSTSKTLTFNIIDVSYNAMGSIKSETCHDNDLTFFRQHLWKILSVQQSYLSKMSIRKHLGSRAFNIISNVMSPEIKTFREVVSLTKDYSDYQKYIENKKRFLELKFSPPSFFKLQRYEEITDPTIALELFVPFPELMRKVREFANISIAGNRGSGKSTYLAALGFFPRAENSSVNYRDIFGIYFPCRMGEFRILSPDLYQNGSHNPGKLKQILIIKIVRRTLEILSEATEYKKLNTPLDYSEFKNSLENITRGKELLNLGKDIVSEIKNFASILTRFEMKEIDNLGDNPSVISGESTINEMDLLRFFQSVKSTFYELANTQFHLLFDDAGRPHLPIEVQNIINDLILGSNPVYCIKYSAEKLTYSTNSSLGKVIENGHDYFEYDISAMLFIGAATTGLNQADLEKYFRKIVTKRLEHFSYSSTNIVDYLGDDEVKNNQLINSLATGRRNAYYFGWSLVWKIADRTPRNLLELVGEIFSAGEITKDSKPIHIDARVQNRAIRIVSEKRLHSLNHISGVLSYGGRDLSVGGLLFDVTSSIGSAFRIYLKEERGKDRKKQTLAIERNESGPLSFESQEILNKLITYGVLDNTKLDYARDDRVKKPIYVLNRIFCPAFGISPQRDSHLRLSRSKFEELMLKPALFLKQGTKKLRVTGNNEPVISDLFGGFDD